MAIIKNGKRYFVDSVSIGEAHRIVARVKGPDSFSAAYEIQCQGPGNYVSDVYDVLQTQPEWSGADFDNSDVAPDFPGSGGAVLYVEQVSLPDAKQQARANINAARDAEEVAGFAAYGKTFDSDKTSQQRILIAANTAQVVGSSFTIDWTCDDNSVITLDYAQMLGLPVIMAQAGNALHQKARTLKEQIDAATTLEEINAVVW